MWTPRTAQFATAPATSRIVDLVFQFLGGIPRQQPADWPRVGGRDLGANVLFSSYGVLKKRADPRDCLVDGCDGHISRHLGAEPPQLSHQLVEIECSAGPQPFGLDFRQASQHAIVRPIWRNKSFSCFPNFDRNSLSRPYNQSPASIWGWIGGCPIR